MKSCGPLEEDGAPQKECSVTPQNNTYTNCELFASMAEPVSGMDTSVLEAVILQGDLEALLSSRTEKEARHKESETTKRRQFGYELRKVEPGEGQTHALVNSELQWLREAITSLHPDGAARSLNADVGQAVVELLRRSCGRGPNSEAKQTLADNKTIV